MELPDERGRISNHPGDRKGTQTVSLGSGWSRENGSQANDADLHLVGVPDGDNLTCATDFLRIALGTPADSRTTIERRATASSGAQTDSSEEE